MKGHFTSSGTGGLNIIPQTFTLNEIELHSNSIRYNLQEHEPVLWFITSYITPDDDGNICPGLR